MALPYDVGIKGEALLDYGLQAEDLIAPVSVLTFGFLWPDNAIWYVCNYGVSTTWTSCGAAPSTTWTEC